VSGTDPSPIIVAGHLTVAAGDRGSYLRSCETVVQSARNSDGCLDFAIGADLIDATRVNVYERWRDRASLEAFRGQGPDDHQMSTLVSIDVVEYQNQT
jgi:quinol monooxygenase YgiN